MAEGAFTFNGQAIPARAGQSIAAALTEAGHHAFRETAKGARRGIFCGMGVCQDCLVTVDGTPNKRACMTVAAPGLTVKTQVAFPALDQANADTSRSPARTITPDILIVGGGAGGLSAAISARAAGASVVVLDERKVPGGQYFKQSADGAELDAQQREGAALLRAAEGCGAEILGGVEVWGAFDGPLILAEYQGGALVARPNTLIVATGAYERPCMVPGWTLPGVMTTGAAQTLWRSYRTQPGQTVAICGSGPLNLQVAQELASGGTEVVMVAEAAPSPTGQPWAALNMALADPGLARKGLGMMRALRQADVPLRHGTRLVLVEDIADKLHATFRGVTGETEVTVDALCMNDGFEPQNEILRLLGAKMTYDQAFGHLRCERSETLETSVPNLFAVGDCAGLGGAPAAMVEGRIAGRAAAAALGFGDGGDHTADQRALKKHRRFQRWLWKLHRPAPNDHADIPDDTILCRCEEISFYDAREGLTNQPGHMGTLKRATRVGMGRCQGRYCGPVAARLVATATGNPLDDHSYFAPRVPIKPVSIAAIVAAQEALDGAD